MAVTIKLKNASGSDPTASDIVVGEPAVRTDTGELFLKKDDNSVVKISAGGISDGDKGDITVSNSGATFTIDSGVIDNANIASDAAISASKISGVMPTSGGTFTGNVSISDNAIEFDSDSGNTNKVSLQGPSSLSGDITLTLPNTDGNSGQALLTDGSGNLSFGTDFGSQAITTTGNLNCSSLTASNGANINNQIIINGATPQIQLVESDANPDYTISASGGIFEIKDATNVATKFSISGGEVISDAKLNCQAGLDTDGDVKLNSGTTNMNILFDASDKALEFDDNVKATFGFDQDLKIFHDGSDNIFESTVDADIVIFKNTAGDSELRVQGHEAGNASLSLYADEGDDPDDRWKFTAFTNGVLDLLFFKGNTSSFATTARFTNDGGTELRHTNVKVFETTSSGIAVTGSITSTDTITTSGNIFCSSDGASDIGTTSVRFGNGFFDNLYGSGANITAINGSNISSGTVAAARVATLNQDTTGNAATATALETARTIGGVSFDGTSNINLAGVNTAGNQDTSGNAATATKLATARTIAGVSFDGSANISLNNNAITNGAGYITDLVNDTSPQLGGDLDTNDHHIVLDQDHFLYFITNGGSAFLGKTSSGLFLQNNGDLFLRGDDVYIRGDNNENCAVFKENGAAELYHDNSKKFETVSGGVTITGTCTATAFSGDGSALTGISSGLPTSGGELTGDLITHNVRPDGNGTRSLGTDSFRWSNIFTSDLHLSNKAKGVNEFDNTWGDYTIQEGLNDLFLKNNRTGKKYKFNLTEID